MTRSTQTDEKQRFTGYLEQTVAQNKHPLDQSIDAFQTIGLDEMVGVALLNRVDTKYVLSTDQLIWVLRRLSCDYRILEINHRKIQQYRTLYFDTDRFDFYQTQVTGRAEVYKVRSREYVDSRMSYLEVKHKDQKHRTDKKRLPITQCGENLDGQMMNFVDASIPLSSRELKARLWNTFRRITLVSTTHPERLTIDLDLQFFNDHHRLALEDIAVAEVKQDQFFIASAFISEMRQLGVRSTGFSKYCFGVSQLYSTVKKNSQKPKVLMIEKIQHRGQNHVFVS